MRRIVLHNYFPARDGVDADIRMLESKLREARAIAASSGSVNAKSYVERIEAELARQRAYKKSGERTNDAVSSSTKEALVEARKIDPLKYFVGIKCIRLVPDGDQWNAAYEFGEDRITLYKKFEAKEYQDKVRTLLHEAGHRGQDKDPETYKAFNAKGLGSVKNFLAMCNKTHRDDYDKNGIDNPDEEAFAESYARFALGLPMPEAIKAFWQSRARAIDARESVAAAIKNHPGVQEVEISLDSDYKYEVFLKEGWSWQNGRNAGGRTGFFHNVSEFRRANPVRS